MLPFGLVPMKIVPPLTMMLLTDQTSSNSLARTLAPRPSWIVPLELMTTFSALPWSRSLLLDWRVILLVTAQPQAAGNRTSRPRVMMHLRGA